MSYLDKKVTGAGGNEILIERGCEVEVETGKHTVGSQVNRYSSHPPTLQTKLISLELCYVYAYLFAYLSLKRQIFSTRKT